MRNNRTRILVETALCVALSVVLNHASLRLPFNVAGGSISLAMLPITVVALRRGWLVGAAAGTLFGLIDLLMDPYILVLPQVILDYPAPYLLYGLGVGVFSGSYLRINTSSGQNDTGSASGSSLPRGTVLVVLSTLLGGILRFISHVLSGVIFFAEYAGDQNVWLYSLTYNISYMAPSILASMICALVLMPLLNRAVPIR